MADFDAIIDDDLYTNSSDSEGETDYINMHNLDCDVADADDIARLMN